MPREAPQACPVCSSDLRHHSPETQTDFAEWEYDCGAIIHLEDSGKLYAYANCPDAMRQAIDRLNMKESA